MYQGFVQVLFVEVADGDALYIGYCSEISCYNMKGNCQLRWDKSIMDILVEIDELPPLADTPDDQLYGRYPGLRVSSLSGIFGNNSLDL